jgi:hypothetical protein
MRRKRNLTTRYRSACRAIKVQCALMRLAASKMLDAVSDAENGYAIDVKELRAMATELDRQLARFR